MNNDSSPTQSPWQRVAGERGYEVEAFATGRTLVPELESLGWLRFHRSLPGAMPPDRHSGLLELVCMLRGQVQWTVGEERQAIRRGQILVVRPGEPHGGEDGSLQPCEKYWLRVAWPARGSIAGLSAEDSDALREALKAWSGRVIDAGESTRAFFQLLHEELRRPEGPHAAAMVRALLQALLIRLRREWTPAPVAAARPAPSPRVARALAWLEDRLCDPELKLSDLAREAGLSQAGLRARFKTETGFTPHEYLLQCRIERAKARLAAGEGAITAIATELGFSSSQYFATVFGRCVGMTPRAYRYKYFKAGTAPQA